MDYKFINMEYLDSVSGGDPGIINDIVSMFRDQAVEIHTEMKDLLAAKNYKMLGLLAHKAKSSVAIMGMAELADMLKKFELQAKEEKEPHMYEGYVERFKTETDKAIIELDDVIAKRSKSN
jgi:HPt (histidine-containing phosphotransfer) domain-containing protein